MPTTSQPVLRTLYMPMHRTTRPIQIYRLASECVISISRVMVNSVRFCKRNVAYYVALLDGHHFKLPSQFLTEADWHELTFNTDVPLNTNQSLNQSFSRHVRVLMPQKYGIRRTTERLFTLKKPLFSYHTGR